jgi:excisionase family DNA binding protein
MTDRDYLTLQEVADTLKVSYRTVYRWVTEDTTLPAYQVGAGTWRVSREDLDKFMEERRRPRRGGGG